MARENPPKIFMAFTSMWASNAMLFFPKKRRDFMYLITMGNLFNGTYGVSQNIMSERVGCEALSSAEG